MKRTQSLSYLLLLGSSLLLSAGAWPWEEPFAVCHSGSEMRYNWDNFTKPKIEQLRRQKPEVYDALKYEWSPLAQALSVAIAAEENYDFEEACTGLARANRIVDTELLKIQQ